MTDKKNNTGIDNSGNRNSGNRNSGNRNSGDYNSGNYNSGNHNSGHYNSGNCNSGHYNSGYYNSGNCNSGNRNSGDYNSGNHNSGNYNSGNCNSGNYNSGNYNSGNYNSGTYNSGYFNTDEPAVRMFNRDTGKKRSEVDIPYIKLKVSEWVTETDMSDAEKKVNPKFHVAGGYLKMRTYKEAWALAWSELDRTTKQKFLDLPNFDAGIFFEITGVDVRTPKTCSGKVVEIDGKKYKLVEV